MARSENTPMLRRVAIAGESLTEESLRSFERKVVPKDAATVSRIHDILSNDVLFMHLADDDKMALVDAMQPESFAADSVILHQGDQGDLFYIIDDGCVEVLLDGQTHSTLQAGQSFGELALMYGCKRQATVKTITAVRLFSIDRSTYRRTLMKSQLDKRRTYIEFLKDVSLLEPLTDYELCTLADLLQPVKYNAGEHIIEEGDVGEEFYLIVKGSVSVTKKQVGGGEREVKRLTRGDHFGEMALLMSARRQASCTAVEQVHAVRLGRAAFERMLGPCLDLLRRNMPLAAPPAAANAPSPSHDHADSPHDDPCSDDAEVIESFADS